MPLWPKITAADFELTQPLEPSDGPTHPGFVFFDAGMVIVDLDWEAFFEGLADHFGPDALDVTHLLQSLTETPLLKDWECGRTGPAAFAQNLNEALRRALNPEAKTLPLPSPLKIKELSSRILGEVRLSVLHLAQKLKKAGYATGILSNASPWHETDLLLKGDFQSAFDLRLFSQDLGCAKPDPRIYELAKDLARDFLKLKQSETFPIYFVDDTPANVRAARDAGWQAALVNPFPCPSTWHDKNIGTLCKQKSQLLFGSQAAMRVESLIAPLLERTTASAAEQLTHKG